MTCRQILGAVVFSAAVLFAGPSQANESAEKPFTSQKGIDLDVPYVPTPRAVVDRMLRISHTGADDIHYDLGCGDGRIVIAAAKKYGVKKGVGIDLDPERIAEANAAAAAEKVTDRVTFITGDLFKFDFTQATVLTLYLLPDINLRLRPTILDMKPGTRVVSHAFTMDNWAPDQQETVEGRKIFYWVVPAKVSGTWEWQMDGKTYRADLAQQFQNMTGTVHVGDAQGAAEDPRLSGAQVSFTTKLPRGRALRFEGQVSGDVIAAKVALDGKAAEVMAKRVH